LNTIQYEKVVKASITLSILYAKEVERGLREMKGKSNSSTVQFISNRIGLAEEKLESIEITVPYQMRSVCVISDWKSPDSRTSEFNVEFKRLFKKVNCPKRKFDAES